MTTTFFQKNTLNDENLEREIDQKNIICYSWYYKLLQVKVALQQASHERFSSRPHDGKNLSKNGFSKTKPSMRNHLMASIATKNKARTETRMSSFIPDSKKRKTQPQTFSILWTSSLLKTKVVEKKISKITSREQHFVRIDKVFSIKSRK